MTKLVIRPRALLELEAAARDYENAVGGLGRRFKRAVKKSLRIIRSHPHAYAVDFESFRAAPIKRFPYVIVYDVMDDEIVVYAVFHAARDPNSLHERRS